MPSNIFGYNQDGTPNYADLQALEEAQAYIEAGASLRVSAAHINSKASRTISHEGLRKRLRKGVYLRGGSLLER